MSDNINPLYLKYLNNDNDNFIQINPLIQNKIRTNGFIEFRKETWKIYKKAYPQLTSTEFSKIAGKLWENLSQNDKNFYLKKSEENKQGVIGESEGESEGYQFVYENDMSDYSNNNDNYCENCAPPVVYDFNEAFNYFPFMNQEEMFFYLTQDTYYCYYPVPVDTDANVYQIGEISNSLNEIVTNDEYFAAYYHGMVE
ncbi:14567_t:CDS:1 [Funneliformis mosseae]|uniref:14567_t:CDS:1 n=1 Tax=Funneliformis mosseae TaxID=27381 RepID=A0A9N9FLX6_FUNMO|nr:14567_t:CDS:1 [Funneliformis mosseae]